MYKKKVKKKIRYVIKNIINTQNECENKNQYT